MPGICLIITLGGMDAFSIILIIIIIIIIIIIVNL